MIMTYLAPEEHIAPIKAWFHKAITATRYGRSPSSTPWFAIFAVSTYRSGIAGEAHPPASCSRSSGVPLRAARVAQ
jgi:hypothetical protein